MANRDYSQSESDSSKDIASDIFNGNPQQNGQEDDDLSLMTLTDNKLLCKWCKDYMFIAFN